MEYKIGNKVLEIKSSSKEMKFKLLENGDTWTYGTIQITQIPRNCILDVVSGISQLINLKPHLNNKEFEQALVHCFNGIMCCKTDTQHYLKLVNYPIYGLWEKIDEFLEKYGFFDIENNFIIPKSKQNYSDYQRIVLLDYKTNYPIEYKGLFEDEKSKEVKEKKVLEKNEPKPVVNITIRNATVEEKPIKVVTKKKIIKTGGKKLKTTLKKAKLKNDIYI